MIDSEKLKEYISLGETSRLYIRIINKKLKNKMTVFLLSAKRQNYLTYRIHSFFTNKSV